VPDLRDEFRNLVNARECAAYRAAESLPQVIAKMNLGETEIALNILHLLWGDYHRADVAINEFRKQHVNDKKENSHVSHATSVSDKQSA
jgi:hypothetical protein